MKKKKISTDRAMLILNLMNVDNIRESEWCGDIYLHGDHALYGQVSLVVKVLGGIEFLTLPAELSGWKKSLKDDDFCQNR